MNEKKFNLIIEEEGEKYYLYPQGYQIKKEKLNWEKDKRSIVVWANYSEGMKVWKKGANEFYRVKITNDNWNGKKSISFIDDKQFNKPEKNIVRQINYYEYELEPIEGKKNKWQTLLPNEFIELLGESFLEKENNSLKCSDCEEPIIFVLGSERKFECKKCKEVICGTCVYIVVKNNKSISYCSRCYDAMELKSKEKKTN